MNLTEKTKNKRKYCSTESSELDIFSQFSFTLRVRIGVLVLERLVRIIIEMLYSNKMMMNLSLPR